MFKRKAEELTQEDPIVDESFKKSKCEDLITDPNQSVVRIYFPSGEVESTIEYVNGKRHGFEMTYDKSGRVLYMQVWNNDSKVKLVYFWDDGSYKHVTLFDPEDERIIETSYFNKQNVLEYKTRFNPDNSRTETICNKNSKTVKI